MLVSKKQGALLLKANKADKKLFEDQGRAGLQMGTGLNAEGVRCRKGRAALDVLVTFASPSTTTILQDGHQKAELSSLRPRPIKLGMAHVTKSSCSIDHCRIRLSCKACLPCEALQQSVVACYSIMQIPRRLAEAVCMYASDTMPYSF